MNKLHIRAERMRFTNRIDLLVHDMSGHIGKPVVMEPHDDGMMCEPTMTIDESQAQQLMDDLWQAGLRPSEGSGSAGALTATQEHLKDMRVIAMHQLNLEPTVIKGGGNRG